MQNLKKGFKDPQCSSKGCLGCTVVPPNLSSSVIKNLGASFYQVDGNKLTDAAHAKKKKVTILAPGKKKEDKKSKGEEEPSPCP